MNGSQKRIALVGVAMAAVAGLFPRFEIVDLRYGTHYNAYGPLIGPKPFSSDLDQVDGNTLFVTWMIIGALTLIGVVAAMRQRVRPQYLKNSRYDLV